MRNAKGLRGLARATLTRDHAAIAPIAAAAFLLLCAFAQRADAATVTYRIPKVNSEIRVDGVLDEPLWKNALMVTLDYEVTPGENIPPPVRTEVYLAYDENRIFVAFKADDPDPKAIQAHLTDRDQIFTDDWVGVFFDTFNDGLRDYGYMCNPLGVQEDMIETSDGDMGSAWDAIWDSAGKITDGGFVVEMSIPFSSLSFQRSAGDQTWGVDLVRDYPRNVRHHIGVFPRDRSNNCYMCQAYKLVGFAGARPGRSLEIDPTLSGVLAQARENETTGRFVDRSRRLDPGLSARWGFTPSMTLSAAVNPDFSQVEADAVQLGINKQFALYYEEKRPFFLESADFFSTALNLLYTRTFADPDWGGKVTGKEGPNVVGLYVVQDGVTNLVFPGSQESRQTSLDMKSVGSVLRYRRDVWTSSNLGVMITDREGTNYYNRVGGVDGNIRITQKELIRFQALGSVTRYPETASKEFAEPASSFTGSGLSVQYSHETKTWGWSGEYQQLGAGLRADLGYVPQTAYRLAEAGVQRMWRNDGEHWYNVLEISPEYHFSEDLDGRLLLLGPSLYFEYQGPRRMAVYSEVFDGKEGFNGKEFLARRAEVDAEIWPTGSLSLFLGVEGGDRVDYDNTRAGRSYRLNPSIEYRLGRHLGLGFGHTFERLRIDEGRLYTANVSSLKLVYQFNRRTFLRAIVQRVDYQRNAGLYTFSVDARTTNVSSQLLFSYKINPQTVLFLGYSDAYLGGEASGGETLHLTQTDRTFFVKIGYAWVP